MRIIFSLLLHFTMFLLSNKTQSYCYKNIKERINKKYDNNNDNDTQEIKSWIDNDNHAYRLGDVVLHAGRYFDDLKSCTLELHKGTLASKYLQSSEYITNPLIARNRNDNIKLFNKILLENCDNNISYENHLMIHLRLGDGIYGQQKVASMRRPYPIQCYEQLLNKLNVSSFKIGLIHNNTASSIFSLPNRSNSSGISSSKASQYLYHFKSKFPKAYDFYPNASPDEHFCAMVNAPVLITGKGKIAVVTALDKFSLFLIMLIHCLLLAYV